MAPVLRYRLMRLHPSRLPLFRCNPPQQRMPGFDERGRLVIFHGYIKLHPASSYPYPVFFNPMFFTPPNSGQPVWIGTVAPSSPLTLYDWISAKDPVKGDNFCGVDRSVDPVRFAGHRITALRHPDKDDYIILDSLVCAIKEIERLGGDVDLILLSPNLYDQLDKAIPSYMKKSGLVHPSKIHTSYGSATVIKELSLTNTAFLLQSDTWEIDFAASLVCTNPGFNARIDFPSASCKPSICECGSEKVGSPRHSTWCPKS